MGSKKANVGQLCSRTIFRLLTTLISQNTTFCPIICLKETLFHDGLILPNQLLVPIKLSNSQPPFPPWSVDHMKLIFPQGMFTLKVPQPIDHFSSFTTVSIFICGHLWGVSQQIQPKLLTWPPVYYKWWGTQNPCYRCNISSRLPITQMGFDSHYGQKGWNVYVWRYSGFLCCYCFGFSPHDFFNHIFITNVSVARRASIFLSPFAHIGTLVCDTDEW